MFKIDEMRLARLATYTTRIERHGDEDKHAMSLTLTLTLAAAELEALAPGITAALFEVDTEQAAIPGVEPAASALRCQRISCVVLVADFMGWTLEVEDGIADVLTFGGCKVDKFRIKPLRGGSCELSFRVGTSDVDAERLGTMAMRLGVTIAFRITPPAEAEAEAS